MNDPIDDLAYAKFLTEQLIAWIAGGGLNLKSIISDQLIIWGHSRGGGLAAASAGVPLGGFELSALVLMSSVYPMFIGAGAKVFKSARSFLGIHTKTDSDPSTSGGANNRGNADDTVVTLYEAAGATDNASEFLLDKHLVFRHSTSGDHFYQGDTVVLGYTVAFLQRHVRKLSYFDRFIRGQRAIASIGDEVTVHHLHEEKLKKVAFSWSGFPEYQVNGASTTDVGNLRSIDAYVLNSTAGLRLSFVRGNACSVHLLFTPPPFYFWDASMYAYLSIAICQSHVSGYSGDAPIRPVVTVWSGQSSVSVDIEKVTGRVLRYPNRYTALMIDQTHVSLDEMFIPTGLLSKFVNLVGLSAITIDLADATPSGGNAVVLIGEIKLTGYGAP